MKYIISQVTEGRTDEEIKKERENVISSMQRVNPDAKCIDCFIDSSLESSNPLYFLSKSLELLSVADLCVFVDYSFEKNRRCKIEYLSCVSYGIDSCLYRTDTKVFEACCG